MAKYEVTFKCGHTETKQLFGPTKERYKKIEWWQENCICSECYKKQQLERAEQYESDNNLVELTGSEKQIKWAKSIRANKLKYIGDMFRSSGLREDEYNNYIKESVLNYFNQFTEASWWIDRRDDQLYYKCRESEKVKEAITNFMNMED